MTNKEAIETLKSNYPDSRYSMLREAVDAAISALIEQDTRIREELFAAVRTIRDYCANQICFTKDKGNCLLTDDKGCVLRLVPNMWQYLEEGGDKDR